MYTFIFKQKEAVIYNYFATCFFTYCVLHMTLISGSQRRAILPPWGHCLETFLIVMTGGEREVATGIMKVAARVAINNLQCKEHPPQQRLVWSKMLIDPRLRNPALGQYT